MSGISGKEPTCQCMRLRGTCLIPGSGRPLEEGMATHSSILARRIPWKRSLAGHSPWGHKESDMTEAT